MHGQRCFTIATWVAPLALLALASACTSESVTPATPSTEAPPVSGEPAAAAVEAAAAPAAAPVTPPSTESAASLTNTYWKLLSLGGTTVDAAPGTREIHLILQLDQKRVAGFSGCNRLMGSYSVDGDRLSFSQMAGTMMACPPPSMEIEGSVHDMLQKVAQWRVDGEKLTLMDASGAILAEFESRYMQ